MSVLRIGILGLQGCIEPHIERLKEVRSNLEIVKVRSLSDLSGISGIILPGGESSTMLKLLDISGLCSALSERIRDGLPAWGICAGSILLAKKVFSPEQRSLGLIDLVAVRNYYGSQQNSFKGEVVLFGSQKEEVDFIRAPLLLSRDEESSGLAIHNNISKYLSEMKRLECFATFEGKGVGYRSGNIIATAFHTELSPQSYLHNYFITDIVGL